MRNKIYLGLVHHPVYDKNKKVVETSITNFDIHDISRAAKTYDIKEYIIIAKSKLQQELAERIMNHWKTGLGRSYNTNRKEAISIVSICDNIKDGINKIEEQEKSKPIIVTTSAKNYNNFADYEKVKEIIYEEKRPIFLLFGTGWGLIEEVMDMSDYILKPIRGNAEYNHLSVRAAVAIILDRLLGEN